MQKFSGETYEINTCRKGKENKQNWAMETGRCCAVSCSQWISWPVPQRSQTGLALHISPRWGRQVALAFIYPTPGIMLWKGNVTLDEVVLFIYKTPEESLQAEGC